jgi:hypothetical protein
MKTAVFIAAVVLDALFLSVAGLASVAEGVAMPGRVCAALVAAALTGCVVLLVLARAGRVPSWGGTAMRFLCCAIPSLWLAGSLDAGRVAVQEAVFLLVVALLAWGTWRVFKSFHPSA